MKKKTGWIITMRPLEAHPDFEQYRKNQYFIDKRYNLDRKEKAIFSLVGILTALLIVFFVFFLLKT